MPIKGMTQAEIDAATRAQVAAGIKSTSKDAKLEGETYAEANARITAGYKEMTAKPILSAEQKDGGMKVQFVRTQAGGVGEYVAVKPLNYTGPTTVKTFTEGVIPANAKYTTGPSVGVDSAAKPVVTATAVVAPTPTPTATATPAPAADAATAVRKLQEGKTLTDAEKKLLGISVTPTATPTPTPSVSGTPKPSPTPTTTPKKFTPEELQDIIRRLTNGEKLTPEEAAAIGVSDPNSITPTPTPSVGGTPAPTPTPTPSVGGTPAPTPTPSVSGMATTTAPLLTTISPTIAATTVAPALTYKATDGTVFTDQAAYVAYQKMLTEGDLSNKAKIAEDLAGRQSAYDLLYTQFASYGLGTLVEPLKGLIQSGASPAEFALKLRNDPLYNTAYKKRFSANDMRISKGLKAISEAAYLDLEDEYQNILRNAGLPESYWKRGDLGVQEGFTNFIANDVSAIELKDRVNTAQSRLLYANPEVSIALKTFYPDITNGDLLAYALDPTKGLEQIKRRITAAEVGSSAVQLGLTTNVTDAEYLARYGVDKADAQAGYGKIAGGLQRGSQLASIYGQTPYTQTTAEQDVFGVPGATEAKAAAKKITGLEKATFGGQTGLSQGALARDRAGSY